MNKYVIYTAVVGNYDEIKQPQVVDGRFDYILFSNDINEKRIGVWQVKPIPYHNPIQTKIARWVKTHPEELLSEYEASLWIDSNIIIIHSVVYERFIEHYSSDTLVSTMRHAFRNCVYDEMFMILCCGFEHENVTLKWGKMLRKEGYPKNNGLCETGVFFRRHSDKKVKEFDRIWWSIIDRYSRRDQYSVNYSLWKTGLNWSYFISRDETVYTSSYLTHVEHKGNVPQRLIFKWNEAWLIRYYQKHVDEKETIENLYYGLYNTPFPVLGAFLCGQYYRIKHLLIK